MAKRKALKISAATSDTALTLRALAVGALIVAALLAAAIYTARAEVLRPYAAAPPRLLLARDDGRYANEPLHAWFDQLASGKGLCCSFADGVKVEDVDWDTGGPDGTYRVRLNGEWINVPDTALVTEPNRFGPAVVWPYVDADGITQIRCFLPGAGA